MKTQVTITIRLSQRLEFEWGFVEPFAYRATFDYVEYGNNERGKEVRNLTARHAQDTIIHKLKQELETQYSEAATLQVLERCEIDHDWHIDRPRTFQ